MRPTCWSTSRPFTATIAWCSTPTARSPCSLRAKFVANSREGSGHETLRLRMFVARVIRGVLSLHRLSVLSGDSLIPRPGLDLLCCPQAAKDDRRADGIRRGRGSPGGGGRLDAWAYAVVLGHAAAG